MVSSRPFKRGRGYFFICFSCSNGRPGNLFQGSVRTVYLHVKIRNDKNMGQSAG
jgi:hypothetical protein